MNAKSGLLLALALALILLPLLLPLKRSEDGLFQGADDRAEALIATTHPDYKPWIGSFWQPPGSEIESLFWAVEAGLGGGLLGYYLGFKRGQTQGRRRHGSDAAD